MELQVSVKKYVVGHHIELLSDLFYHNAATPQFFLYCMYISEIAIDV